MKKAVLVLTAIVSMFSSQLVFASSADLVLAKKCPTGQHWDRKMKMCMPN